MTTSDGEAGPRILDVGQCGVDHGAISRYLSDRFGARVERAETGDEARRMLESVRYDLVLINRVLDLDGSPGLNLLRTLKEATDQSLAAVPVILVSDYPEAQQAAQKLGAAPGFGKASLHSPTTLARIKALLSG
jgi:DNA-binding response OmpR family regulator